jgi:hypothetical protein
VPITVNGSPYSFDVQPDDASATRMPFCVHEYEFAWWRPNAWPSSCAITPTLMPGDPLTHDCVPGMYEVPDHPQAETVGKP